MIRKVLKLMRDDEESLYKNAKVYFNMRRKPLEILITRNKGWYPYKNDWDTLIILDALRFDLAKDSVASSAFGNPEKIWSIASNSPRWIERTFKSASDEQLKNTAYISSNPFTNNAPDSIGLCSNVLEFAFDKDIGTVPPRKVTDEAIRVARSQEFERHIIHYMQPHLPPVDYSSDLSDFISPPENTRSDNNPWEDVENGIRDGQDVKEAYENNLSTVVSDVEVLLENIDSDKAVITADHGNFLGEKGKWGHRYWDSLHSAVRQVPYWETSSTDKKTYSPPNTDKTESDTSRKERLRSLGYMED